MSRPDLSPQAVAARLDWLRTHVVPHDERAARARLEDPEGLRPRDSFDQAVAHRLAELRVLCELTERS
jgi:predicted unusual protein kinase regulating ubiquinone biosynthesis (AarF/ABC1/UbiB family)